ncbi:MAG: Ig-like domain-containing protein, partial [Verrucomicrobia bacterium]|nr:Ig-like domain-containing protein [Verrucomicrobiota bacterium]
PADDAPEVVNGIADVSADEDAANVIVSLLSVFNDVDDNATIVKTVQANTNLGLVTATIVGDDLTLDFQANGFGTATITVRGTSNGKTADDSFEVTVAPMDDAPVVTNAISDVFADEDDLDYVISMANVFNDVDDDNASIVKTSPANTNPELVTATIVGNELTLDFQPNRFGSATITVRGASNGKAADDSLEVTVSPVDDAPVVATPLSDVSFVNIAPDATIDLSNVFADVDDDNGSIVKTLQSNGNPDIVTATVTDDSLVLDFQPDANGSTTITVTGTSNGKSADATFTLEVFALNAPPVVAAPITDVVANEDDPHRTIDLSNLFVAPDDEQITKTAASGNSSLVTAVIDGDLLTLSFQPDASGTTSITVTGNSRGQRVDDVFTVTVSPVDDPPELSKSLPDVNAWEDDKSVTIDLSNVFNDVDVDNASIEKAASSGNAAVVVASVTGETLTLDFLPNAYGSSVITVLGSSNGKVASGNFNVTVSPIDDPPAFSSSPPLRVSRGSSYGYSVSATDPDGNASLVMTAPTKPNWLTLTDRGEGLATLIGTPPVQLSDHAVILSISDGNATTTQSFTISVTEHNSPPIIAQGEVVEVVMSEDGTPEAWIAPVLSATDAEGDVLAWSLKDSPVNGSVSIEGNGTSLGAFAYEPAIDFNGFDTFVVQVSDGEFIDEVRINVTLTPVNDPPRFTSTPPIKGKEEEFYFADLTTSDVDGPGSPTLALLEGPAWLTLENSGDGSGLLRGVAPLGSGGAHAVSLSITDEANATGELNFFIQVGSGQSPTLSLKGSSRIRHPKGEPFQDPGYFAFDELDGDLTSSVIITGKVDANAPGVYTLTYEVSDRDDNEAAPVAREIYIPDPSQTPRALQVVSPKGAIETAAVAVGPSGVRYLAGSFRDTATFGEVTLQAENGDAFLTCLEANGSVRWARSFGGLGRDEATDVAIGPDGSIYLSGTFEGLVQVDGLPLISSGGADGFLIKLDPEGSLQWEQTVGGPGEDSGQSVTIASDGSIRWVGNVEEGAALNGNPLASSGKGDVFVAKISPAGDVDWAQTAGGENIDRVEAVVTDPVTGFTYLAGGVSDGVQDNAFLLQYDDNGTLRWGTKLTGAMDNQVLDLAADESGVYLAGNFEGEARIGSLTMTSKGNSDGFLAKLDPDGAPQWTHTIGGPGSDYAQSVEIDPYGDPVLTGHFLDSASVGGHSIASAGSSDLFLLQASGDSGGVMRIRSIGGTGSEQAGELAIGPDGTMHISARHGGETTADDFQLDNEGKPGSFLVVAGGPNGLPETTIPSELSIEPGKSFAIDLNASMPNGPKPSFFIPNAPDWLFLQDNGDGAAILSGTIPPSAQGDITTTIRVSDLEGGTVERKLVLKTGVPVTHTVSVSVVPADAANIAGMGTYEHGTRITLVATPLDGYRLSHWSGSAVTTPNSSTQTLTVTNDFTLTATFELAPSIPVTHMVSVSVVPADAATIEGMGTYEHGALITLVATPLDGYRLSYWSGNAVTTPNSSTQTLTVNEDVALTATFELDPDAGTLVSILDAEDLGNFWHRSPWFGYFHQTTENWIYHLDFGWIYSVPPGSGSLDRRRRSSDTNDNDGVWLWQEELGWAWTTADVFPYLYQERPSGWLFYSKGSSNPAILYDFGNQEWFAIAQPDHHVETNAMPTEGGDVVGGGSYKGGTDAYLVAKPSNGFIFEGWEGDAQGSENPLLIQNLENSMSIGAKFKSIAGGMQGIASVIENATHLTTEQKRTALVQIAFTGSSPLVSIGSGDTTSSQDSRVNLIAQAFGLKTANSNFSNFGADSAQLKHPYLPWEQGWSGQVDAEGGKKLSLETTITEKVNDVDCLVVNATPANGSWETRWLARDKKGTIWIMRETRNQQSTDLHQPFLPSIPEAGWKSWTNASAIPDNYAVVSNLTSKIRLQSGEIIENCLRLIVHSSEGTRIEYYANGRGLVRTEKP